MGNCVQYCIALPYAVSYAVDDVLLLLLQ